MARSNDSFEALSKRTRTRSQCPRCGNSFEPGSPRGRIMLALESHTGPNLDRKVQASKSKNLCEPCGVRVYEILVGEFEDQIGKVV